MVNWIELQEMCIYCRGDGTLDTLDGGGAPVSNLCPYCKGEGYIEAGRVKIKSIDDKLDEILAKLGP